MGVVGIVEYLSDGIRQLKKPKKKKIMKTVALKVRMDCEGCVHKLKNLLSGMKGVKTVDVDLKQQKVTVSGFVEPNKVLKRVQATKKKVEIWPYVPYNRVAHPYISQAYDKKAPPGFVRAVDTNTANITESMIDDHFTNMFSDDNPTACSIM